MSLLRHGPTALRIALVAAVASSALVLPAAGAAAVSTAYDALEAPLVRQINGTRAARGLPTLRVATRLTTAATRHASSMGSGGYFRHDFRTPGRRLDWTPFESWIRWYWPGPGYTSWSAGENLFCSTYRPSAREVVRAWMNSPSHRMILLTRRFRNVGVSAVNVAGWAGNFGGCAGNVTLVVAEFGRRS